MPKIEYVEDSWDTEQLLESLSPPVRNWFKDKFPDFTDPQKLAIPRILNGEHLLLCSPTGSGKTLDCIPFYYRRFSTSLIRRKVWTIQFSAFTSHQLKR